MIMNEFTSLIEEKIRVSFEKLFDEYKINNYIMNTVYIVMLIQSLFITFVGTKKFTISLFFTTFIVYALNLANIFVSYKEQKKKENFIIQTHFMLYDLAIKYPKIFWISVILLLLFLYFLVKFMRKAFVLVTSFLFTAAFLENDYVSRAINDKENVYLIYSLVFLSVFFMLCVFLLIFLKIGFSLFYALVGTLFSLTAIFALINSIYIYLNYDFFAMVDTKECDYTIVILYLIMFLIGFIIQIRK